jgi:glycerol-3-phosphate dehydrogenase
MPPSSRLAPLTSEFDIAVIGGGIIGCGIARDAAQRGMRVALFEKTDYGAGTTSGSTRLIHGGLRYLEMYDFGLVRMDLRERETLLRIAKGRIRPLRFLMPFHRSSFYQRLRIRAGMILYDLLSYDRSLPGHRMLSRKEALELEPGLNPDGLQGAASFYDAQVDMPEQLAAANILDARRMGAIAMNYVEVTGAVREGERITGVTVRDAITGESAEVRARVVVNASGPWFDRVAARIEEEAPVRIRTTKGIHLACEPVVEQAHAVLSHIDGRLFFVIPWMGYTWVGTTDTDFEGDPGEARATPEDVNYLITSAVAYFPKLANAKVYWTNSGVRALVLRKGDPSSVSRTHRIDQSPGVISVLGGKITGYRAIAEDAVDAVAKVLGNNAACRSAALPLPEPCEPLSDLETFVRQVVREEQCVRVGDLLFRRTRLGFAPDQGRRIASDVIRWMADELGWSSERRAVELALLDEHYNKTIGTERNTGAAARKDRGVRGI